VLAVLKEVGLDRKHRRRLQRRQRRLRAAWRRTTIPWRDGKQDHYDGGLRVPFMMRWPAQIKPGQPSDYQGLNFDLVPTFLELAGAKPARRSSSMR
jgi:hypothetical protein